MKRICSVARRIASSGVFGHILFWGNVWAHIWFCYSCKTAIFFLVNSELEIYKICSCHVWVGKLYLHRYLYNWKDMICIIHAVVGLCCRLHKHNCYVFCGQGGRIPGLMTPLIGLHNYHFISTQTWTHRTWAHSSLSQHQSEANKPITYTPLSPINCSHWFSCQKIDWISRKYLQHFFK